MLRLLSRTCRLQRAGGRLFSSTNDKNPLERAVKFSVGEKLHGYTVKGVTAVQDFDLVAVQLTHDRTNAQHLHVAKNDSNNAFGVGFRTTPMDSTGVAHILEHTVLCGSHKYPVRDPFFKMLRRSLATFMNAFTANDWTLYPFSTQNEKDYYNLMSVYLDCVFHPLLRELDFRQEGWRLEHEDPTDPKSPIIFKGVVFNEMKGVFANPENIYAQALQNKLYPGHTYSHVSGGDPLDILDLTWERLKHFHATHYHPSNARFFTYGNLPLPDHLNYINSEVLQNYQQSSPSEEVPLEPRWNQPTEHWITCPVDSLTGDQDKQTFVGVSFLLSPITDPYESLCLSVLCQLLVDGPASPFYQTLIDSHVGTEYTPNTGYDNSTREASFSVGLQGVRRDDVQKVKDMIWSTLENVASEGFSQERVRAALHQIELGLKHQTSGFGVSLMLSLMSPWVHDGNPADLLQVNHNIEKFKQESQDPAFFKNMTSRWFLNNKHHVTLVMEPDEKYASKRKSEESEKLHLTLSSLSARNNIDVYQKGLDLLSHQDIQENTVSLPSLNISDVDQNVRRTHLDHDHAGGVPMQYSEQPTNGITYFRALSGIALLPDSLKIYVPLFCNAITQMGTDSYDHRQFAQQCDLYTGGFTARCHVSAYHSSSTKSEQGVLFSSHCLDDNLLYMLHLWEELFCRPTIHDEQRLRTVINVTANNMVMNVARSGHQFAMSAASSGLTPAASLSEEFNGITQVNFLKKITELDDLSEVEHKLASVAAEVLDCGSFRCAVNCSANSMAPVRQAMDGFIATLPGKSADISSLVEHNDIKEGQRVLKYDLNFPVNYVGHSLKTVPYQHEDSPRLDILAILMTNNYLHREIREKGGAYGTGAIHGDGLFSFFSYRDPNSHSTLEAFDRCIKWAAEGKFSDEDVDEARLSLFSKIDYPVAPGSRGTRMFLHHISDEMRQDYRQKIFKASKSDVVDVALRYLESDVFGSAVIGGGDLK